MTSLFAKRGARAPEFDRERVGRVTRVGEFNAKKGTA